MEWVVWFAALAAHAQHTESNEPPMQTTTVGIVIAIAMLSLIPIVAIAGHFWYKRTEDKR